MDRQGFTDLSIQGPGPKARDVQSSSANHRPRERIVASKSSMIIRSKRVKNDGDFNSSKGQGLARPATREAVRAV